MGQGAVGQNRQDHRHSDAVVPAQRGPVRPDPLPIGHQVQALLGHIFGAVLCLDAHHVDVALEDHGGGPLIAGGGLLPDDYVVYIVLPPAQAQLLGKGDAQIADLLSVVTAVGDGAQLFKILKYLLGLQPGQYCHHKFLLR